MLVLALLALTAGLVAGSAAADATQNYSDPSGDANGAADVTDVQAANNAGGDITLRLTFFNKTSLTNEGIAVYVDSDENTATPGGSCAGSDFRLRYFAGDSTPFAIDTNCNPGTGLYSTPSPQPASFSATSLSAATPLTFKINRSDLGNTTAFKFFVFTQSSTPPVASGDYAPDTNSYEYALDLQKPTAPPALTATVLSETAVDLTWGPSTDNRGVAGYRVSRNGNQLVTTTGTSYADRSTLAGTAYTYNVLAYDDAGNVSDASAFPLQTPDQHAPSAPANLTAKATEKNVTLTWSASLDNVGVSGYSVYRDNVLVGKTSGATATTYVDTDVSPAKTYGYVVKANDGAGNLSDPSTAASALVPDLTAPSVPARFAAKGVGKAVVLSWNKSTDAVGVDEYTIFRNRKQLKVVDGTALGYRDTSVSPWSKYTYWVTATDAAGNVSGKSAAKVVGWPDTDHDRVPDVLDKCNLHDGRSLAERRSWAYDRNKNGCAGPFDPLVPEGMSPADIVHFDAGGPPWIITGFNLGIRRVHGRASVSVKGRATTHASGPGPIIRIPQLDGPLAGLQAYADITIVAHGYIGYAFRVGLPGGNVTNVRCIPAYGKATPTACNGVTGR